MRLQRTLFALCVIAPTSACTAAQDTSPDSEPAQASASGKLADPMASFARMLPGEWRAKFASGTTQFDTWHWGPGRHSMRRVTDGSDAVGGPWRALEVFYWHPGLEQVRVWGVGPFMSSLSEGTLRFEGETAEAVFDLYQSGDLRHEPGSPRRETGILRKIASRWTFDGPDKYRAILLEAAEAGRYEPLIGADWNYARSMTLSASPPRTGAEAPKPSERLKSLDWLVGQTWEAQSEELTGQAVHIRSTVEWIPYVDAIYARTMTQSRSGGPLHLLDTYVYRHTGTGALRCLALSNRGGVYEGDLTVLDGGTLELTVKGYEGDQVVPLVVRFDLEKDGTLRDRVWSLRGTDRKLTFDFHHKKLESKKD